MLVFSLAVVPLSVSRDATRAASLLYCRSPRKGRGEAVGKMRKSLDFTFNFNSGELLYCLMSGL